ncbi:MAG: hypothetical protein ACRD5H_09535, partial [Nitrososphaerales archaeon]
DIVEQDNDRPASALMLVGTSAARWSNTSEHVFTKHFVERSAALFEDKYGLTADGEPTLEFAQARLIFTLILKYAGRHEEALRLAEFAINQMRSDVRLMKPVLAEALVSLAILCGLIGDFEKGKLALAEAEAIILEMQEVPHDLQKLVLLARGELITQEAGGIEMLANATQNTNQAVLSQIQQSFTSLLANADPADRLLLMQGGIMQIESLFGKSSPKAIEARINWGYWFFVHGQFSDSLSILREAIAVNDQQPSGDHWSQERQLATFLLCQSLFALGKLEEFEENLCLLTKQLQAGAITNPELKTAIELEVAEFNLLKATPADQPREFELYINLLKNNPYNPDANKIATVIELINKAQKGEDVGLAEIESSLSELDNIPNVNPFIRLSCKQVACKTNALEGNYDRAIKLKKEILNALILSQGSDRLKTRNALLEIAEICQQSGQLGDAHKWRKKALREYVPDSAETAEAWAREAPKLAYELIHLRSPQEANDLMERVLATPISLLPALSPHRWEARRRRVQALIELKEVTAARQAIDELINDMSDSDYADSAWKAIVETLAAEIAILEADIQRAIIHNDRALVLCSELTDAQ